MSAIRDISPDCECTKIVTTAAFALRREKFLTQGAGGSRQRDVRLIGAEIRRARHVQGMTQDEFAGYLGVSRASVIQLETGKPTKQLERLTTALGLLGMDLRVAERR